MAPKPAPSPVPAAPDDVVASLGRMTPDQRAAFLGSMSAQDLQALIDANPQVMGNTDGVPFPARIAANRINIHNALNDEQQKPNPSAARITQLRAMLAPIEDPEFARDHSATAEGTQGNPFDGLMNRQFVAFSHAGGGRMIEMIGNLHPGNKGVSVYVPGMGTNLNGSSVNHNAAWNLARLSNSPAFLYMNGELPQKLLPEAAFPGDARAMARGLVEFGKEVDRAVKDNAPGTPVTYIGHSYGGSVVGSAEQLGLRADRVLYASSAGTGVYDGPWVNKNPKVQRFSMTAPGDLIGATQSLDKRINPHGSDPDEMPGVTRLDTGYYSQSNRDHPGEIVFGPDGHGDYWNDPGSTAFANMAGVISGGDVTGYVERGIESNKIDVNLGDEGHWIDEGIDGVKGLVLPLISGLHLPRIPGIHRPIVIPQFAKDPYGNPRVTDHPELGPTIDIK